MQRIFKSLTPVQWLFLGYFLMALLGAILLSLPISSANGTSQAFIDSFFTSSSTLTTTGLVVVDTGSYYTLFGQLVILTLTQIGGLGYMIFFALLMAGFGGRLSFTSRMLLRDSMNRPSWIDMVKFVKVIIIITFTFEFFGGLILGLYWMKDFKPAFAFYLGFFHSISAFCTSGFGFFPDSLISYSNSLIINFTIMVLSIAGAIGFFVFFDIYKYIKKFIKGELPRQFSSHSKLVIILSIILMVGGGILIFIAEVINGAVSNIPQGFLDAVFQSMTASCTVGFNTVDIGKLTSSSLFILIISMFIGASPGGTGGGIKTTSFGVIVLFLYSLFRGSNEVSVFKRRIVPEVIKNSFAITFIAIIVIAFSVGILTFSEKVPFQSILFEVVSALSNVGLSCGMTSGLTAVGKIVISFVMLIGRVGPLAVVIGIRRQKDFKYADAEILVG